MGKRDARIDAYIAKSADFAKPILRQVREVVHAACPDVEETLKWSSPTFMFAGGILCGMAAFKEHCHFHFWKGALLTDDAGASVNESYRDLTSVKDLPSKRTMTAHIQAAMKLNAEGVKVPKAKAAAKPEPEVPADLAAALRRNKKANQAFTTFSPSHRREYIEWIVDAKREETRERRIQQTLEWLAEGKPRNWKYM